MKIKRLKFERHYGDKNFQAPLKYSLKNQIRKQKILKNLGFVGCVVLPVITLIILL